MGARLHTGGAAVVAWTVVLLLPVLVTPGAFHGHVTGRWLVLGLAVLAGVLLGPVVLWSRVPRAVQWGWLAFLASAALATLTARFPLEALLGDSARRLGLLTLVVLPGVYAIGAAARERRGPTLRVAAVVAGGVVAVLTVELVRVGPGLARTALVGNSGQLGGYLVVLAGLSAAAAQHDPDPRWRRVAAATTLAALAWIPLTGSYTATLAGLVLLGWFGWQARGTAPRLVPAAAAAGTLLVVTALTWTEQFRAIGPSLRGRWHTWLASLTVIGERPLLGWGPEGFRHGFAAHAPAEFVATWGDERIQDRAHSLLLDHAAATGLLGLAALLFLLVAVVRAVDTGDPVDRSLLAALTASGVFLLGWFPEFELAAVLFAVAGLATATAPQPTAARPRTEASHPPATVLAVVPVVAAVLLTSVATWALVEDRRFQTTLLAAADDPTDDPTADPTTALRHAFGATTGYTEQLAALAPATRADHDQLGAAVAALDTATPWQRPDLDAEVAFVRARLLDARTATGGSDSTEVARATSAYRAALDLAPHHTPSWQGLAQLQARSGDPQARTSLERLARLRPSDIGPRYDLVVLALQAGDAAAAGRWLEEACSLASDDPQLEGLVSLAADRGVRVAPCD